MPAPPAKQREIAKLSRSYRRLAAKERAEAAERAPILLHLSAALAGSATSVCQWVAAHAPSLTVDARTAGTALRMLADWHERETGTLSDPLFDEPDDFWIWARDLLTKRRTVKMPLQLLITGDSLADLHRECQRIARDGMRGVEDVAGNDLQVTAPANTKPMAAAPAPTAAPPVQPAAVAAPKPPPSIDEVRTAVNDLAKRKGKDAALAVLRQFGVETIPALPATRYAEVLMAVDVAG